MTFRLFQYTLPADSDLEELNAFLARHRIATVNQQIVATAGGPMLVFVVETVGTVPGSKSGPSTSAPKIDYREVLTDEQFAIYSRLREERKRVADAAGVPVYAVFKNAQLAEMVTGQLTTVAALSKIAGIGKGRVEKYASHFLPILTEALPESPENQT